MQPGKLWGISVGAGNAEWLTLKGLRVLQAVPVVAFPQNRQGNPGMAYEIVKDYLSSEQEILPLFLPFVTNEEALQQAWEAAAERLMAVLETGKDVAFLSEGDVSFYSTFTYVSLTLQAQYPEVEIEAIPGVCSPLAAAASLHLPLAIANEKVAILPAFYDVASFEQALTWADTIVLMKVASVFPQVWQLLSEKELLHRAKLIEWVGWHQERVLQDLSELSEYHPPYFSILILRLHDPYNF